MKIENAIGEKSLIKYSYIEIAVEDTENAYTNTDVDIYNDGKGEGRTVIIISESDDSDSQSVKISLPDRLAKEICRDIYTQYQTTLDGVLSAKNLFETE